MVAHMVQRDLMAGLSLPRCPGSDSRSVDELQRLLKEAPRYARPLGKLGDLPQGGQIRALDRALRELRKLDFATALSNLESYVTQLKDARAEALRNRREELQRRAKKFDWPHKRLKEYDFVGCFEVRYREERVTLRLGSETLTTFDEVDGGKLFSRIEQEKRRLDDFPFNREDFFKLLEDAIQLAHARKEGHDGNVPIRVLYPIVVIVRNLDDQHFVKKPGENTFKPYPMVQFIYDFARFGRDGWGTDGGRRLRSQTPNMASIARGSTVTLPSLKGTSGGVQIGSVSIQRDQRV